MAGLQKQVQAKESFREAGQAMATAQLEQMKLQFAKFKEGLEEYARKHRKEINRNPLLRSQFQQMCTSIGVDPLLSAKGFWADLLGVGDFYYELGVQVVETCLLARERTGGLVDFASVKERIGRLRGNSITDDDLVRAVGTLKPLDSGFAIVTVGQRKLIQSVPKELSQDHHLLLEAAERNAGKLLQLDWPAERFGRALKSLIEEGLVWVDLQATQPEYWFPCFFPRLAT